MADFSSLTSRFRAYRTGPQESLTSKVVKRPRLACNQCQRAKLRCDRGQPCSSCLKKGEATICVYQQLPGPRSSTSRNVVAEDRLKHLESLVKQLMDNKVSDQAGNNIPEADISVPNGSRNPPEAGNEEFSKHPEDTRYVGSTHWSAILEDIQELKVVLGSSGHVQSEDDLATFEAPDVKGELIFGSSENYSLQQIISQYLPAKVEINRFLSLYFQGEAYIVPFVHTYHFQRQYQEFWKDTANVNPLWLSMLFSICQMSSLIGGAIYQLSQNELATRRYDLHTAAGKCLVLGEYHKPQQFAIEALALYGHCKSLWSLDSSREVGAILGMVVRKAYEMGYHRDPDSFGSFTPFEGEMRRRLWASCKQMDLMISFQLGLPSNICIENCDTRSPRNLLDSDFDTDTKVLPPSRPENEGSRLLWFIVKERQMVSFSKVCKHALSFKVKSEDEILQLDKEIREMHTTIPDVLRTRPVSESIVDSSFLIMTRIYVEFIYLKSLCVLHRKYMTRGNMFSTRCCLEAGTKLVSQFIDIYEEFKPGGQLHMERWMLSSFTMNDFLFGVMVLCLVVHTYRKAGPEGSGIDSVMEAEILRLLEKSHAICVEKSGSMRDARRASHAVRIILGRLDPVQPPKNTTAQPPQLAHYSNLPQTNEIASLDTQTLLLSPWHSYFMENQETFDLLDPLHFLTDDMENVDWPSPEPPYKA